MATPITTSTPRENITRDKRDDTSRKALPKKGDKVRMHPEHAESLGIDAQAIGVVDDVFEYNDPHPGSKFYGQGDETEPYRVTVTFPVTFDGEEMTTTQTLRPGQVVPVKAPPAAAPAR